MLSWRNRLGSLRKSSWILQNVRHSLRQAENLPKGPSTIHVSQSELEDWDQDIPAREWKKKPHKDVERLFVPKLRRESRIEGGNQKIKEDRFAKLSQTDKYRKDKHIKTEAREIQTDSLKRNSKSKANFNSEKVTKKLDSKAKRQTRTKPSGAVFTKLFYPDEPGFPQVRPLEKDKIPRLAHQLDRVLFSPGVHFLQDPRTRIFNYDPYLRNIVNIDDFDFDKIAGFISAAKDKELLGEAIRQKCQFYSSTLSMTLTLHQFYLFLNNYDRNAYLRFNYVPFSRTCMLLPLSVIVQPKGTDELGKTVYSITSDKSADQEILLGAMGHCMEVFLTHSPEEMEAFLKERKESTMENEFNDTETINEIDIKDDVKEEIKVTKDVKLEIVKEEDEATHEMTEEKIRSEVQVKEKDCEEKDVAGEQETKDVNIVKQATKDTGKGNTNLKKKDTAANVYNYLRFGNFLMRSQLDCYDARLPGNGTFDLKTRACCAVRYDQASEEYGSDYQIWKTTGEYESFEREYNDLIRTGALLKYGFQARIGQMDGIFVAYHNLKSFFGFQYLPLLEIDRVFYLDKHVERSIHKSPYHETQDNLPSVVAEDQFKTSLAMWLDIIKCVLSELQGTEHEKLAFRLVMKYVPNHPKKTTQDDSPEAVKKDIDELQLLHLQVFAVPLNLEQLDKLQSYSRKFETLFRANISTEERTNNLEAYKKALDNFNAQVAAKNPVLYYQVTASVDTGTHHARKHPYPESVHVTPAYTYQIRARHDYVNPVSRYLNLVERLSSTLVMGRPADNKRPPGIAGEMRRFAAAGRRRQAAWAEYEEPVQRFRPADVNRE